MSFYTSLTGLNAATAALSDFKNPYNTNTAAIRSSGSFGNDRDVGYTSIVTSGTDINVLTCYVTPCSSNGNRTSTIIAVE